MWTRPLLTCSFTSSEGLGFSSLLTEQLGGQRSADGAFPVVEGFTGRNAVEPSQLTDRLGALCSQYNQHSVCIM